MLTQCKFCLLLFMASCALLLSACMGEGAFKHVAPVQKYDTYTVRKGDTLQKIAARFAVTEDKVTKSNGMTKASVIKVGQTLRIPVPLSMTTTAEFAAQPVSPLPLHSLLWPARGKVVRIFSKVKDGCKGIDIAGGYGQEILASGDGRVVYSGTGLSGFGNMIIIKHNDKVVTVYALNKSVVVKEGQWVKAGEKIGEMGGGKHGDVFLHFEVRIDGKPQDPLLYLEKM